MQILSILKAAYPMFYKDLKDSDIDDTANLWEEMFSDDPAAVVGAAVKAFIATDDKGYPPNIGAIKTMISKLSAGEQLTGMEAWTIVRKAMSAYATREDFEKLPPAIQRAVGGSSQLVTWALSESTSLPVIMSHFMNSYKNAVEQEKNTALLPKGVREIVGAAGTKCLSEGEK